MEAQTESDDSAQTVDLRMFTFGYKCWRFVTQPLIDSSWILSILVFFIVNKVHKRNHTKTRFVIKIINKMLNVHLGHSPHIRIATYYSNSSSSV